MLRHIGNRWKRNIMKYLYRLSYNRIMILSVKWYQNIKLNILIHVISLPMRNML